MQKAAFENTDNIAGKMKYQSLLLHNFRDIPQIRHLSEEQKFEIEAGGSVKQYSPR